ncbi:MAG: NAD(P)/FAD-dependent oxidoreductase [Thermoplasmata archaeon]
MAEFDAIIVGAGHNGLVTAGYLSRAGARVLVLEKRGVVGGACVTEEPWPGYKISTFGYAAGLLRPKIVEELELKRFGYRPILCDPQGFSPFPDGRSLTFWLDERKTQQEIARFSNRDAEAYPKYLAWWDGIIDQIDPLLLAPPLPLGEMLDSWTGSDPQQLLKDLFLQSAADLLDGWFESEELKGVLASGSIIGTMAGPRTPGTAYILAHNSVGILEGHRRIWGIAEGGMGNITQAMARSATHLGAQIRTGAGVREILVEGGRAVGVLTEAGEIHRAPTIVSGLDLRQTFLRLLPEDAVDLGFRLRVKKIRNEGACLKFNAALERLPQYTAATAPSRLAGALDISPSIDYLEHAYDEAKYGRFSSRPYIDIYHQSILDPSVAPPGKHTMTCFVEYAPTELRGSDWNDVRPQVAETVLDTIQEYAPDIRQTVRQWQVVTPQDIENQLGMTGGNIDQGDITPDQLFSFRPIPGWTSYRTPLPGLYLCGCATHPGGGVLGAPGHNAAQVILADWTAAKGGSGASAKVPAPI